MPTRMTLKTPFFFFLMVTLLIGALAQAEPEMANLIEWLAACHKAGVLTEEQIGLNMSEVGSADFAVGDGLAGSAHDDRLLFQVLGAFQGGHDDCAAAVADDAAVEKMQRIRDHSTRQNIFARDRLLHLRMSRGEPIRIG